MDYCCIVERANRICELRGIDKRIYTKSGAGKDFVSNVKKGSVPSIEKVAAIADFLECSIDYLLERTENPDAHKSANVVYGDLSNNSGIVGNVGSTIHTAAPSGQAAKLVELFNNLEPLKQARLLVYADELNNTQGGKL